MSVDGNLRYIFIHKVLAMWSEYIYCLDASDVVLTLPRESLLLSSDYYKSIKECSFCMISETYFQEDYFLDQS